MSGIDPGKLAEWFGDRAPGLVLSVPALSALLPGLAIFQAMSLLAGGDPQGIAALFGAMATALAIGTGVAFGDLVGAPADRWVRHPAR